MSHATVHAVAVFAAGMLAWPLTALFPQSHLDFLTETVVRDQDRLENVADTARAKASREQQTQPPWWAGIDAGYHTPPVHPYFRDEYRVLQDMRRLILFINPVAIQDMASVPEMLAAARAMPEDRQTEIIGTAIAGSIVNQASDMVSRSLRHRHAGFIQWQLEKIVLQTGYHQFYASMYYGVNVQGFAVQAPFHGLAYSFHNTPAYTYQGVSLSPLRFLGLQYGYLNGNPIYGPRLASRLGSLAMNFDTAQPAVLTAFEFRRQSRVIVRVLYANYLMLAFADFLRSEVILSW